MKTYLAVFTITVCLFFSGCYIGGSGHDGYGGGGRTSFAVGFSNGFNSVGWSPWGYSYNRYRGGYHRGHRSNWPRHRSYRHHRRHR